MRGGITKNMSVIGIIFLAVFAFGAYIVSIDEANKKAKEKQNEEQKIQIKELTESFIQSEFTDIIFKKIVTESSNSLLDAIHISNDSLSCNYIFSYNLNDDSLCYTTFNIDYRSLGYENLKSHMEILAFTNALVYKLGNNYRSEYHNDNDNSYKDYCIKYKYTSEYKEKLKQEIISKMPLKKTH